MYRCINIHSLLQNPVGCSVLAGGAGAQGAGHFPSYRPGALRGHRTHQHPESFSRERSPAFAWRLAALRRRSSSLALHRAHLAILCRPVSEGGLKRVAAQPSPGPRCLPAWLLVPGLSGPGGPLNRPSPAPLPSHPKPQIHSQLPRSLSLCSGCPAPPPPRLPSPCSHPTGDQRENVSQDSFPRDSPSLPPTQPQFGLRADHG